MKAKARFNPKQALLLLLYLTILISLRYLWFNANTASEHPEAQQGVLDMRGWDFEHSPSIQLDGEWEFYPGQFLGYEDSAGQAAAAPISSRFQVTGAAASRKGSNPLWAMAHTSCVSL